MAGKWRSTKESRKSAWDEMMGELRDLEHRDNAQIAQRITELRAFSCNPDEHVREELVVELALLLAKKIIDAA